MASHPFAEFLHPRDVFLWTVGQYHGSFYAWGGDDPGGFDCSGLAIEGLKSAGKLPRKFDTTAAGLHGHFAPTDHPRPGCLAFRENRAGKIVHVEVVIAVLGADVFCLGASGGGRNTRTREDAIRDNAFIKIRPVWRGAFYADPFG